MRKSLVALVLALTLTVALSTSAFAHYCSNANKQDGAGSSATLVLDPVTFEPISYEVTKPNGKDVGGFLTIVIGDESFDTFVHNLLPEGALSSGSGDSQCDAQGIDSALACLGFTEEAGH